MKTNSGKPNMKPASLSINTRSLYCAACDKHGSMPAMVPEAERDWLSRQHVCPICDTYTYPIGQSALDYLVREGNDE